MVVGIVLGSIALFLCLLLLCPLKLSLWYGEDLTLKIGYGPIRIRILPQKEQPEKIKKEKKPKKEPPSEEKEPTFFQRLKEQHGISGTAALGNRGYQAGSLHHEKAVLSCGGVSSPGRYSIVRRRCSRHSNFIWSCLRRIAALHDSAAAPCAKEKAQGYNYASFSRFCVGRFSYQRVCASRH